MQLISTSLIFREELPKCCRQAPSSCQKIVILAQDLQIAPNHLHENLFDESTLF